MYLFTLEPTGDKQKCFINGNLIDKLIKFLKESEN